MLFRLFHKDLLANDISCLKMIYLPPINLSTSLFFKYQMNKSDLIDAISKGADITKVQADAALATLLDSIRKALKKGDRVQLIGFGTFSVTKRAARTGRNPQTGKAIKIAAKKVARFKVGKELAETVK